MSFIEAKAYQSVSGRYHEALREHPIQDVLFLAKFSSTLHFLDP